LPIAVVIIVLIGVCCMAGTYWVCLYRGRIFGTDPEEEGEEEAKAVKHNRSISAATDRPLK